MAEFHVQSSQPPPNGGLRPFFMRVLVMGIAVFLAVTVVPGIESDSLSAAVGAVLVLTLLNTLVRPLLYLLSLPLIVAVARPVSGGDQRPALATDRLTREGFYRRRFLGFLLGRPRHQRGQRAIERHPGSGTCQRKNQQPTPPSSHYYQSWLNTRLRKKTLTGTRLSLSYQKSTGTMRPRHPTCTTASDNL